jgi:hypothetical protein
MGTEFLKRLEEPVHCQGMQVFIFSITFEPLVRSNATKYKGLFQLGLGLVLFVLCLWPDHREEIAQRGNRHLDNLNFCVTRSTQVPRATQNLSASAVAEIS